MTRLPVCVVGVGNWLLGKGRKEQAPAEVAEIMATTPKAVKQLLYNARQHLSALVPQ